MSTLSRKLPPPGSRMGTIEATERAAEDSAIRFLLDGLDVDSIKTLHRLVGAGRWAEAGFHRNPFPDDAGMQLAYETIHGRGVDPDELREKMEAYSGDFWLDFFGPLIDRIGDRDGQRRMIIWAKVKLPRSVGRATAEHLAFSCDEAVRDPSLAYEIGRTTGGHFGADGTLHVQIELDEKALIDRLAERRGAF